MDLDTLRTQATSATEEAGKLEGSIQDVEKLEEEIENKNIKAAKNRLKQKWGNIKSVAPV